MIPILRAHILVDVSPVSDVSYSQIWDINIVQNRAGEPNIQKMNFRAVSSEVTRALLKRTEPFK